MENQDMDAYKEYSAGKNKARLWYITGKNQKSYGDSIGDNN